MLMSCMADEGFRALLQLAPPPDGAVGGALGGALVPRALLNAFLMRLITQSEEAVGGGAERVKRGKNTHKVCTHSCIGPRTSPARQLLSEARGRLVGHRK